MLLSFTGLNEKQKKCLAELQPMLGFSCENSGFPFDVVESPDAISVKWDGHRGTVAFSEPHHFARCIGLIVEKLRVCSAPFEIEEHPLYDTLGYMIDCSRNGLLTQDAFKDIARRTALMGYSMIQLYTEDTYELPGYPYFGYMRPRFTGEDIKAMDAYADIFGIELTPCIQTLAHLNQFLQWDASSGLRDIQNILLAGSEDTYKFIECQFKAISEYYTSRRVNIGLDEAHMLGLGSYLSKNGYRDKKEIMLEHCARVFEIARKYGFRPMMWGDSFCGFAYTRWGASNRGGDIADVEGIKFPDDVDLLDWDYFRDDSDFVENMLARYRGLTPNTIFAPGAWKCTSFAPFNRFSYRIGKAQHKVCAENGVKEILLTTWGDNGGLASEYSVMPVVQLWAELCYKNDDSDIKTRFKTCMDADFDEFYDLDMSNAAGDVANTTDGHDNPSQYLLYQDVLMGLFDRHVSPFYKEHFKKWAIEFDNFVKKNEKWAYLFETSRDLCRVLEIKCNIGLDLYDAYQGGDKATIRDIAENLLPELITRMKLFHKSMTRQWMREHNAIGLDSFDLKLGGVMTRLDVARERLLDYLDGRVDTLPELERERLLFDKDMNPDTLAIHNNSWVRNVTANILV